MKTLILSILIIILGFAGVSCAGTPVKKIETRDSVEGVLSNTRVMLKNEELEKIRKLFDTDYYTGFGELQNRILDTWKREQLLKIDFTINRALKTKDGLVNVQVRWYKLYLDAGGRQRKKSGVSEMILKPYGETYKILDVQGDQFF